MVKRRPAITESPPAEPSLVDLAQGEQKLRTKVVSLIGKFLADPEVAVILKFLVILGLLDIVVISFISSMAILHTIVALAGKIEMHSPLNYVYAISGLFIIFMLVALPLVMRADTAAKSAKTKHDLDRIVKARSGKRRPAR